MCLPGNGRMQLRARTVTTAPPYFGHLIAWTIWRWRVSWKLDVTGHVVLYFRLVFNEKSHYGELVREFRSILYKVHVKLLHCVLKLVLFNEETQSLHEANRLNKTLKHSASPSKRLQSPHPLQTDVYPPINILTPWQINPYRLPVTHPCPSDATLRACLATDSLACD
jgi:hypothetical protein